MPATSLSHPSFNVTAEELAIIRKITERAVALGKAHRIKLGRMDVQMDVTATHANGCPLRLADLLAADDFKFAHDIFGIGRHLDRSTGQLTGFFVPRFAAPEADAA